KPVTSRFSTKHAAQTATIVAVRSCTLVGQALSPAKRSLPVLPIPPKPLPAACLKHGKRIIRPLPGTSRCGGTGGTQCSSCSRAPALFLERRVLAARRDRHRG